MAGNLRDRLSIEMHSKIEINSLTFENNVLLVRFLFKCYIFVWRCHSIGKKWLQGNYLHWYYEALEFYEKIQNWIKPLILIIHVLPI